MSAFVGEGKGTSVSPSASPREPLDGIISRARQSLQVLGEGHEPLARRVADLARRLDEGRLHLAVVGQFKRGKSTFLNALLGEALLPTAVVPLTAAPVFITYGPTRSVSVRFQDGRSEEWAEEAGDGDLAGRLAAYVTEEGNPGNRLGVVEAEVRHPSPWALRGVILIDTPGIGSTFRHNTNTALAFLPRCDAALFVISADPPITEVEVEFLHAVRERASRIFFVLNKVDYLAPKEREEAVCFLHRVLAEKGERGEPEVFCVSARLALEARRRGDSALWAASGMDAIEGRLEEFLAGEKAETLRQAISTKVRDVLAEALMNVGLERRALELPLAELDRRMEEFDRLLAEVETQRLRAADLLEGDRTRLRDSIETMAEDLRVRGRSHFLAIASAEGGHPLSPPHELQTFQARVREAVPAFFESARAEVGAQLDARIDQGLLPHLRRWEELAEGLRQAAASLFEVPYLPTVARAPLERLREPYWVTEGTMAGFDSIPRRFLEALLPAGVRSRRLQQRLRREIGAIVLRNVENLRWATIQNLEETFRDFRRRLEERLQQVAGDAQRAIRSGYDRRREQADTAAGALERLDVAHREVTDVLTDLEARLRS